MFRHFGRGQAQLLGKNPEFSKNVHHQISARSKNAGLGELQCLSLSLSFSTDDFPDYYFLSIFRHFCRGYAQLLGKSPEYPKNAHHDMSAAVTAMFLPSTSYELGTDVHIPLGSGTKQMRLAISDPQKLELVTSLPIANALPSPHSGYSTHLIYKSTQRKYNTQELSN